MSALHTSGPWVHRVMTMPRKVWAALGRSEIQVVAKNGNVIAAVWCAEDRPGEKEANAVLIAGCIDMLDMLNRCEMWLGTNPEGRAMQMAIRAVVSKVTAAP